MSTSLRNQIRGLELQRMLRTLCNVQRSGFVTKRQVVELRDNPVLPEVESHLANFVLKSRRDQNTVRFIDGTDYMETTVISYTDSSQLNHVNISSGKTDTTCMLRIFYNWYGFPCLHGLGLVCEKHGSMNFYKLIPECHLTVS